MHLKIGDPAARFVAETRIALATRGIRDPDVLRTMPLRKFVAMKNAPPANGREQSYEQCKAQ